MKKIAFVLHGKVGGIKGKHFQNEESSIAVLTHSAENFKKKFKENFDVDVFIHSWSTELEEEIINKFNPLRHKIERQIQFTIPDFIVAKNERAFAHLSRWYSFREAVQLINDYIEISKLELEDIKYDHVIVQRFDLLWNVVPDFESMDSNCFWIGKSTLDNNKEWSDRWFSSNFDTMYKFSKLYDKIPEYMQSSLPSSKQYGGISSHQLCKYHAEQIGAVPKFKYNFGGYGSKPNDYNEVRRQIYKNDD